MRKGEIACNKQFLLFSQSFLPYVAFIFHFKSTLKCHLQFFFNLDQSEILSPGKELTFLPNMPILGSSNSAANRFMMSKIWTNGNAVI